MKRVSKSHTKAMDLAEQAMVAKARRQPTKARDLFAQALLSERKAAMHLLDRTDDEPSRSVLFRSAASLAFHAGEFREAERMISHALVGEPPEEILEGLRDLQEDIHFNRHLELRDVVLEERELQMSIAGGPAAGLGVVESEQFLVRFDSVEKMFYRTAERRQGRPFREKGRVSNRIKNDYKLFLSSPRAGSFAVTIRLGKRKEQPDLPGMDAAGEIVDDFLDSLALINERKDLELRDKIRDEAYYNNFVVLAKQIAPDGQNVKMVGFTARLRKGETRIAFSRQSEDIRPLAVKSRRKAEPVEYEGMLSYADAKNNKIKIVDDTGKNRIIHVPPGMLGDIVKPLWEHTVRIKGFRDRDGIRLDSITRIP